MENVNIPTKNLKLAQIRYFDAKHNGVEIPKEKAYAFVLKVDDKYVNPLNPEEEYPVYARVPYSNTTRDGEDYGTKIVLASGEVKSGPCYVMEKVGDDHLFEEDTISLKRLEDYVVHSHLFFMDSVYILNDRRNQLLYSGDSNSDNRKAIKKIDKLLNEKLPKRVAFKTYLISCEVEEEQNQK